MAGTGISSSRQSVQRTSGHAIQDSMVSRQPHKTNQASDQGNSPTPRSVNSGGHGDGTHDDEEGDSHDRSMSGASPVRKRKRGGSFNAIDCKRRLRASNETRKRQSTNAAHAPKRQERYRSPGPSKPPPEARSRADVAEVEKGEDTGAKSTTDSAKNEANAKELQALGRTEINHGSANDDVEYEVERILAVRLRRGNL
ncbi:hypothetical protein BU23DRAFT_194377 [Bimuria novae-zelandiae CBS 107.79]|uniref:Uncharacterized protein n=1 Tax=Bimuria novae-zelandiae CBS 107.79 TaxID=1447943 RepID=A0A6A5V4X1_9PLEO|nr:hypothetical protein BU23DRAFT_194377 [Bimuria novae-zelandiae CBS 107.79]